MYLEHPLQILESLQSVFIPGFDYRSLSAVCKSVEWSYEKECRLISNPAVVRGMNIEVRLPIKAVYFGSKFGYDSMDQTQEQRNLNLRFRNLLIERSIPRFVSKITSNEFSIVFDEIDDSGLKKLILDDGTTTYDVYKGEIDRFVSLTTWRCRKALTSAHVHHQHFDESCPHNIRNSTIHPAEDSPMQQTHPPNKLDRVICQIRFPTVLSVEDEIDRFRKLMVPDYPNYELLTGMQMSPGNPVPRDHAFTSDDGCWTVTISIAALSLTTSSYSDWKDFFSRFGKVLETFYGCFKIQKVDRIGLRYVNAIKPSSLGYKPGDYSDMINQKFIVPPKIVGKAPDEYNATLLTKMDDGTECRSRYGTITFTDGERGFCIDNDLFRTSHYPPKTLWMCSMISMLIPYRHSWRLPLRFSGKRWVFDR